MQEPIVEKLQLSGISGAAYETPKNVVDYVSKKPGRKTGTEVTSVEGSVSSTDIDDIVTKAGGFSNATTISTSNGTGLIQTKKTAKGIKTAKAHSSGNLTTKLLVDSGTIDDPLSPFGGFKITRDKAISENHHIIGSMLHSISTIAGSVKDIFKNKDVAALPLSVITEINGLRDTIVSDGKIYFDQIDQQINYLKDIESVDKDKWTDADYLKTLHVANELMAIQENIDNTLLLSHSQIQAIIAEQVNNDAVATKS